MRDAFVESNVHPQRQNGYNTVEVKVTRGDLTPEQFRGIAQIMRDFTGGYARTSVHQNLILRWVRDESIYEVWCRLGELGLGDAGADEITDVVSCPGTDSCKLAITSSMGLNQAISERLGNDGYAFANANAVPNIDKEKRTVAFNIVVDPGRRVYVRRVNITGNSKTRDEVVRMDRVGGT